MWLWNSIKKNYVLFILVFTFHLLCTWFNYQYRMQRGIADAFSYWGEGMWDFSSVTYLDLLKPGNAFFVGTHFFLTECNLPIWVGFLYHSFIGFIGCWVFYLWCSSVIKPSTKLQHNICIAFAFLPNMHIWTSNLGKEGILFLCIALILYSLKNNLKNILCIAVCTFFIMMIRPHLFIILSTSIVIGYLLTYKFNLKGKLTLVFSLILMIVISLTSMYYIGYLQETSIKDFIQLQERHYNNYINMGGSFVDMKNKNLLQKVFIFLYKPLDFTNQNLLILFSSIYNFFILSLSILSLYISIVNFKSIKKMPLYVGILIYVILSAAVFTLLYGNIGLFMRTKVLCVPFILPILIKISLNHYNSLYEKT